MSRGQIYRIIGPSSATIGTAEGARNRKNAYPPLHAGAGVETLLRLGSTNRAWRTAFEPLLFRDLVCSDVSEVVGAAKVLAQPAGNEADSPLRKKGSILRHVEHLQLM